MQWNVQVFTQTTITLCWEACARSMWQWKYGELVGYAAKAGNWLNITRGLSEHEVDQFYRSLGMRHHRHPTLIALQTALMQGPVAFANTGKGFRHALVVSGYNHNAFSVMNPCTHESLQFSEAGGVVGACIGGRVTIRTNALNGQLGMFLWHW